jgi:DNA polymerase-3 subunit epsilon
MIFDAEWRYQRRFHTAAKRAPNGPLADFCAAGPADMRGATAKMAAIDLKTDGLNAATYPILELGYAAIEKWQVDLSTALRARIKPKSALRCETVVVHRITDDAIAFADDEAAVLARVLPLLAGRVIVVHFAQIEAAFLDAACQRIYGAPFIAPLICSFQLENRWFSAVRQNDQLRLGNLRRAYNLPVYTAHDGLIDAIACGEVLLAQRSRKGAEKVRVGDMIRR